MKTRVQTALVCSVLSVFALGYLALHYYPIKFGFAGGQSVCNLNAKFNCDAVSASAYSAWFGIPVALWGASTYAVLFFMVLLGWLEWSDHPERLRRWAVLLSGVALAASAVMGVVSAFLLQNYCLFCIVTYVLSAVIFFVYRGVLHEPFWMHIQRDLSQIFSESKGILVAFAVIPVMSYLAHRYFMQDFGDAEISRIVSETVRDWEAAPKQDFVAKPTLSMGPAGDSASLTLIEFADFRCGHCKAASYTLDAFVRAHPDVRFEFYTFPLDGACNEKIEGNNGISCRLAYAVYCAEKEAKGWPLHHALFETQEEVNRTGSPSEVDVLLSKHVAQLGLNWESVQRCMEDPTTLDAVKAQAKQGALVNVRGTPTVFANGRLLNRGQLVPVLAAVHEKASAKP